MTFLPSLLQKIDNFHRLAAKNLLQKTGQAFTMPDDPEEDTPEQPQVEPSGPGLYPRIVAIANEFSNQDIAEEILLIAELYRKALEINGGYTLVNKMLSTALSNMDSLMDEGVAGENELEAAEDILNEVSRDLRTRSKAPGQANEATAMRELKAARDAFNQKAIYEEVAAQPTVYEKGKPGAETGHGIGARPTPETPQKYAMEIGRLRDIATDPANQNSRDSINQLIGVLEALVRQMSVVNELKDTLKLTPNDQETIGKLDLAANELNRLRTERKNLKGKLNRTLQENELQSLRRGLNVADPSERKLLQEKIALQQLRLSSDRRKKEEIKWRQVLINSMSGGHTIPEEQEAKIRQKIQEGARLKKTPEEIDKETADIARKLKRTMGPTYTKEERAKGEQTGFNKYDWANMELANLVEHLERSILAKRKTFKDAVLRAIENEGQNPAGLKPFIDNVATAANSKKDIGPALTELRKAIKSVPKVNDDIIIFLLSIRVSKLLYNFRDQLRIVNVWLGYPKSKKLRLEFTPDFNKLSGSQIEGVRNIIETGKNLISRFEAYKAKIPFKTQVSPGESPPSSWGGKSPTMAINIAKMIVSYLENNINRVGA